VRVSAGYGWMDGGWGRRPGQYWVLLDWETGTGTGGGPHGVHGMERHLRRCICSVGFGEKVRSEFYRVRRRRKMTAIMEEGGASSGFVS